MRKLFLLIAVCTSLMAQAEEKTIITSAYAFGFSASFKDSVVYFTEISEVDSLFMNSKTKFILGRDNYSYQLKNYLEGTLGEKNRTCVFLYELEEEKLMKKFVKMFNQYQKDGYIVKTIGLKQFKFIPIDMTEMAGKIKESKKNKKKKGEFPGGQMPPGNGQAPPSGGGQMPPGGGGGGQMPPR